jgi:hypothetical protein
MVPADGPGTPTGAIVDWARGKVYLWNQSTPAIRVYTTALTTQSPILSALLTGIVMYCGDVDPISGRLIIQDGAGLNGAVIHKYDAATLALLATFGVSTSFPTYPGSVWLGQSLVCIAVSGVGYAALKESALSGGVAVIRTDTMTQAGFYAAVVSGSADSRGLMCRGASGGARGSVFLTWEGAVNGQSATIPLYTVVITAGAETYNPASWPTPNPHISSATIGTIAAAAIDPAWTTLQCNSIGYDQTDGNVLMDVVTSNAVPQQHYIAKINAATAAVMWAVPMGLTGFPGTQLAGYNVAVGAPKFLPIGLGDVITTATGALNSAPMAGVTMTNGTAMGDDVSGLMVVQTGYTAGGTAPVAVSGTPSSFTGWAIIGGTQGPPPPPPPGPPFPPLVGRTFVYDLATQLWHERCSAAAGSGIWAINTATPLDARLLLGDAVNGNLYHMDASLDTENGVVVPRLAVLPSIVTHGPRGFMNRVEVEMEVGTVGSPGSVTLDWSDDGGITWTPYQRVLSTGAMGKTRTRVATTRLGSFRQRVLRLQALGKATIYGLDADVPILSDAFATVQTSAAGKPGLLPQPLASQSYALASHPASAERLLNWHAEKLPAHARSSSASAVAAPAFYLKPTAGTSPFATMGSGPILCTASLAGGFWAISGDHAWFLLDDGSAPQDLGFVGTVPSVRYATSIAIGLTGVVFCVPPNAFLTDLAGAPVTQITTISGNFPTGGCSSVCFMDGYYVFTSFDTTEMFVSKLLDATQYDPLAFVRLSSFTDYGERIVTHNSEVWVFGDKAVQVWYDGGDPTFPFLPHPGAVIYHGIGALASLVEVDGTLFYLSIDKVVYQITGYAAERRSSHALEEVLATYGGGDLDGISAFGFMHEGHAFYALQLPLAPAAT